MRRRARRAGRRLLETSQRYLALLASGGTLAFVIAIAYASDRIVREQIATESRAHAARTAELLGRSAYGPALFARGGPARPASAALRAELDATTRAAVGTGAILNATIWDLEGRVVYSERHRFIGERHRAPTSVVAALGGRDIVRHSRERESPLDAARDRLEVSLPLRRDRNSPVAAVLDLDIPYARIAADISQRTGRLDTIVLAAGALLYLGLLPFFIRAGRLAARNHDPRRARLVDELEDAIDRGELELEYQPLIDLKTGAVTSVEALVRWQHPRRGRVPPDEFIPVAETTPFFWDFSLHVLTLALEHCAAVRRTGIDLSVAVNVSSANLLDRRLPHELRRLLAKHELPPGALELEVTEGAIMEESERAAAVLGEVAAVGVGCIAIDDFGTGHSSLARVRALPIDALKIDRSFIREMDLTGDSALVRSVIALAHNLGLIVVAEGIERPETARRLAQLGCDRGQGYCISRPLGAEDLIEWLAQRDEPTGDGGDDERRAGPGRRRDDYFSIAFKNAPEAMLIADDAGRWIDANRAACALVGVTRADIRLRRFGAFSANKSQADIDALWQELTGTGTASGSWTVRTADAEAREVEFEATANFVPGLHLFVIRPAAVASG